MAVGDSFNGSVVGGNESVLQEEAPLNHDGLSTKMNISKGLLRGLFPDREGAIQKWKSQGYRKAIKIFSLYLLDKVTRTLPIH